MLSTMGEKFDISFDEAQQEEEEDKLTHHRSINPENRIEDPSCAETHPTQDGEQTPNEVNSNQFPPEVGRELLSNHAEMEEMGSQVPFLPLLD
jgi:hypothetical protein